MDKHTEELRDLGNDIDNLKRRKEEIKKKALEHRDTVTDTAADEAISEIGKINADIQAKESRKAEIQKEIKEKGEERIMTNEYIAAAAENEKREAAVKSLRETRSMAISTGEIRSTLIASDGIAKPTKVDGVGQPFNTLISILDQVKVVDMKGAGTYKKAFLRTHSAASAKTDGAAQDASDPSFGTVTITPSALAVTSYVSTELENVTPINYYNEVRNSAGVALRVKLAQDIVTKIKTSVDDPADATDTAAAMYETLTASAANGLLTGSSSLSGAIDEKTLRTITMNYGGEANVYGGAVLYLNKKDLIAFGDVRGTNEKKAVYEITPNPANPNIGIIKDGGLSVPYCIVPTLTEHSGKAQSATTAIQTMIYGSPLNFELALFGDMQIKVSEDYKFAEGLLTILGKVTVGGSIVVPNGFVIVTIPKS